MNLQPFLKTVAAGALMGLLAAVPARAEEVVLKAVTAFPASLDFAQSFQRFVAKANEMGKGVVQIQYMGGPEVVPPPQQAQAVRRGVIDMQYGPGTYYLGDMPEVDAWVGSTVSAMEARKNGGAIRYFRNLSQDRSLMPTSGQPMPSTTPRSSAV